MSQGVVALQDLSTLWALVSEGMAVQFGVASRKLGLCSACARSAGVGVQSFGKGCNVSEVPGHLWQRRGLYRHKAVLDGLFN